MTPSTICWIGCAELVKIGGSHAPTGGARRHQGAGCWRCLTSRYTTLVTGMVRQSVALCVGWA